MKTRKTYLPVVCKDTIITKHANSPFKFKHPLIVDAPSKIKMPPRMLKRGHPKGADLTIIGIPSKRRRKGSKNIKRPTLFINKSPTEKAVCK